MSRMLNVRIDEDLWAAIDASCARYGVTRSTWLRETLAAAVTDPPAHPHPPQALMLQPANQPRTHVPGCKHPPTAITALPFTDVCRVCGAAVRHR